MESENPIEREAEPIVAPQGKASWLIGTESTGSPSPVGESASRCDERLSAGFLIVNADDWGRDCLNTDRTVECVLRGAVSSVSAMVFMEDSERAAGISRQFGIDTGLHLNLTSPFTGSGCPSRLLEHQMRLSKYLKGSRFAQVVFHPGLVSSFAYVVKAQLEEFDRLYAAAPQRLDGHHHMHLCANVLLAQLLPRGILVRRNFSFQRGEKSFGNRAYRKVVDRMLARRHRLVDFFYSLPPMDVPGRIQRIFSLASDYVVELETHPVNQDEHRFLAGGEIFRKIGTTRIAPFRSLPSSSRFSGEVSPEHKV